MCITTRGHQAIAGGIGTCVVWQAPFVALEAEFLQQAPGLLFALHIPFQRAPDTINLVRHQHDRMFAGNHRRAIRIMKMQRGDCMRVFHTVDADIAETPQPQCDFHRWRTAEAGFLGFRQRYVEV